MCASGRASTWLYRPFSVWTSCARVCTPQDVHPRSCTGLFRCVRPVCVVVRLWKCIHVYIPYFFPYQALYRCLHVSGRASTSLLRPISVCTLCACMFTSLNVHPRASSGPFRCEGPLNVCVRLWTCINIFAQAIFGVYALFTCVYASGRASTYLYQPFSVCTPCARVCTPQDVHQRSCNGLFRCVRLVCVVVRPWKCIHVYIPYFPYEALCRCVHVSGRASASLLRPISVCTLCGCVFTSLNVHQRASTGPFRCEGPLNVCVRLWTCINIFAQAIFGVYALFTCVYASGRASTYLYQPFSVCTPCARVCTPQGVHPRSCTGLFRCLRHVCVVVLLWKCIHVYIP